MALWRENLKSFISYYRPHRGLFILDMSAGVLNAGFTTLLPLVLYKVVQEYLPERNLTALIWGATLMAVLAVLITAAEYVGIRWGHILGARLETDMRSDLFRFLQKLSFSYFDRTKTGHLMSRMTNDLNLISETAHHAPEDLLISVLTFIGAFTVMFHLNAMLAGITLIPLPFIVLWGAMFQKKLHYGFRTVREKVAEINSQVENAIQGIREVKSYNNETDQISRFSVVNKNFLSAKESVCRVLADFHCGISLLLNSYSLLFIAAGVILIYFNRATLAELLAFMMYSRYVTFPILRMVNFAEQTQQTAAAFERFREIMREKPEIQDVPNAIVLPQVKGRLQLVDLDFKYQDMTEDEPWVLKNISMDIQPGQTVALVGESGAGKSTIAALIPRFYESASGHICLDGVDISQLKQRFLRAQIGIVQQTPFLFDATIRENLLIGKPDAAPEELKQAAQAANILDFIESLPGRFDSYVGEHGVRLSGGQRQRISLARVFLKNPAVLIFDEATSALDNESEALVQDAIERLCHNRTTIIIAHRLSTVRNANYIYCLKHGQVVESGTHAELLQLNGYYKELYTMHTF